MVFRMGEPDLAGHDVITLRSEPLISRNILILLASLAGGALIGLVATAGSLQARGLMIIYPVLVTFMAGFMLLPRFLKRKALSQREIVFRDDDLALPPVGGRLSATEVAYAELRSVTVRGKGKRTRLLIDIGARVLLLPVREFAEPADYERFIDCLRQRITALPEGAQRWSEMEERRKAAQHFSTVRPMACWVMLAVTVLVWLAQQGRPSPDGLGAIDFGANASLLVVQGQWFRLVTANLLHSGLLHLFFNSLFAWVIGSLVERQMGHARFLLVVMVTGIASQITSTLYAEHVSHFLYSVGLSGSLMGLLGAQAALNWRFGKQLPAGYRFPARSWWSILLINFVFVPLRVGNVDNAAHVGGLISGALLGFVLCQGIEPGKRVEAGWTVFPLAAMALTWLIGIGTAVPHLVDPTKRLADRVVLATGVMGETKSNGAVDNSLAWDLAIAPDADAHLLSVAHTLATRAVAQNKGNAAMTDTLATTEYRLGNSETAISLERRLLRATYVDPDFPAQLTRFLAAQLAKGGPVLNGLPAGDLPAVSWTQPNSKLHVEARKIYPKGIELWLLVKRHNVVLGGLQVRLRGGAADIPLTAAVPLDDTDLHLALADAGGSCDCDDQPSRATFYPMADAIRKLP